MANDNKSIAHTKWNCKYHIVFATKYRRKVFFGEKREAIGKILRQLCEWKGIEIIEAEVCPDHVHMLVNTAKDCSIEFHGIPEREEQPNDLRTIREPEIQVQGKRILVPRVLRRYGGKEQTEDCRVYQTSTG